MFGSMIDFSINCVKVFVPISLIKTCIMYLYCAEIR